MGTARSRVLKYARTMLAKQDRLPTPDEVKAFIARGAPISQAATEKLMAEYGRGADIVERLIRMEMKYLPRIRKRKRAI